MNATIFFNLSIGPLVGKSHHMTEEADTAEECLRRLQDRLWQKLDYTPVLTFRPHDGMIFCEAMSYDIPIGVLYQKGYAREF
jgi:hypothetical protein